MNIFYGLTTAAMNDVTVSLDSVVSALVATVYVIVGIVLIILLIKVLSLIKKVKTLVDDNCENINKTLSDVPVITENVKDISSTTKQVVDIAGETVVNVLDSVSVISGTAKKGSGIIGIVTSILPIVMKIMGKRRGQDDSCRKRKNKKHK